VVKEINYPRLPSLRRKQLARQIEIPVWGPADIEADTKNLGLKGSPTRVVKISTPQVTRNGKLLTPKNENEIEAAVDQLIEFLQGKEII